MVQKQDIAYLLDEVKATYRQIHQYPERGFAELETVKLIVSMLESWGLAPRVVMRTGVIVDIPGRGPGRTIALRADIDALPLTEATDLPYASKRPGFMHACGHDAHAAMLLGAGRWLAEHRDQFDGTVRLMFQPAEEGWAEEDFAEAEKEGAIDWGGAASLIKAGALEGVDLCLALHVEPSIHTGQVYCAAGPIAAAADNFYLTVVGKGGHGAQPQEAIDPVQTAAEIILAFHALPARECSALDRCVVSVCTLRADSETENVLPNTVRMSGTVRTFDQALRERIAKRMEEIAVNICAANRCKAEFRYLYGWDPVINEPAAAALMTDVARDLVGAEQVLTLIPEMGAEDVGEYFLRVPGAMSKVGITPPGEEPTILHNPLFRVDLDALGVGVCLHINSALRFLNGT